MASAWARDSSLPTQSTTTSAPPVSVPETSSERDRRRTTPGQVPGVDHHVGPELLGQGALMGVARPDEHGARRGEVDQGGDGAQAEGSRPEHRHGVSGPHPGVEGGVHGAGGGLHHDGVVVGQRVGDEVQL